MSLLRASKNASPFSEIRELERNRTLAVIALSTLTATSCLIVGVVIAIGAMV